MSRRFVLGAIAVGVLWFTCRTRRELGKVEVKYRVIRYTEADELLELAWEPLVGGKPPIAYVPSPRRWRAEMPEWAQDRRDEIFPEIQRQTLYMNFTWKEYD